MKRKHSPKKGWNWIDVGIGVVALVLAVQVTMPLWQDSALTANSRLTQMHRSAANMDTEAASKGERTKKCITDFMKKHIERSDALTICNEQMGK